MSTKLNNVIDADGREFAGRFTTKAELDADGLPAARDGIVELLDDDGETIADEWVTTPEAAQEWLDAFDFDEYHREQAEGDFDDWDGYGDYY